MEVLYIPQLDEVDASGETTATRYKLLTKIPEAGVVGLEDKTVNKIAITDETDIRLVVPPLIRGQVRDFFVRLVITSDAVPEITFAAPTGEIISFEDVDEDILKCEIGVNVFSFTENDEGVFFVNRKTMDIDHSVEFDSCGGSSVTSPVVFKLGSKFSTLPKPVLAGMVFQGWFTVAEGGTLVTANDTVKTGITKLYAQWAEYVDPYVDAICDAKNLTFHSESASPWSVDSTNYHSSPGAARSGAIGDGGSTNIQAMVSGPGTLTFWWKVSSEQSYDWLRIMVDGVSRQQISGYIDWTQVTVSVTGAGTHTLQWQYDKDGSVSNGSDCGWIDDVVWTPSGT